VPDRPGHVVPGFWAAWQYNRADPAFQSFVARMPYYAVWDDHEVANDFGPHHDTGSTETNPAQRHLLEPGRQAFLDYNPFPPETDTSNTLYRTVRWGRRQLFLLDTRRYRDANADTDSAAEPKPCSAPRGAWLRRGCASDATWKIIVTGVPLAIPTGDRFAAATGGPTSTNPRVLNWLLAILRVMQRQGIRNHLWISTDVHFSAVFRHTPFADDPSFQFYEVETGPLNAGVFPKQEFDTTLHPERLFLFPATCETSAGFREAMTWFTFGLIRVDDTGVLTVDIVNTSGTTLFSHHTLPTR
jgi:alkaline phosphatase D